MGAANGLKVVLVLGGNGPRHASGNLLIDEILGAEIIHCSQAERPTEVEKALKRLEASGHRPLHIPVGGSAPIGVEAYAEGVGGTSNSANLVGCQIRSYMRVAVAVPKRVLLLG